MGGGVQAVLSCRVYERLVISSFQLISDQLSFETSPRSKSRPLLRALDPRIFATASQDAVDSGWRAPIGQSHLCTVLVCPNLGVSSAFFGRETSSAGQHSGHIGGGVGMLLR